MTLKLQAGKFYGAASAKLTVPGFRFTESSYEAGLNLPSHSHELAHFCLVLNGSYTERLGNKNEERRPSALLFYPPDTVHAETSHSGGRHFLIEIEPWRLAQVPQSEMSTEPLALRNQPQHSVANRLVHEFRNRDELSSLALESLTLELMVSLARNRLRSANDPPKWLIEIKNVLDQSFRNPPSLDQLARLVDVHPVHVARAFHRFQRCTIGDYLRQLRIADARRRIMISNESLAEIALSSGFSDQSHFSRSFKRVMGMTPTDFRKLARGR